MAVGEPVPKDADPGRFYDAETGQVLCMQLQQQGAKFKLLRQFAYRDPCHKKPFIVPLDLEHFTTDFASIPFFFAWLVPALSPELPAFILHDGLIPKKRGEPEHVGPDVTRIEADWMLRDAMESLGAPLIRRWIVWAGVVAGTLWTLRWRWLRVGGLVGTVVVLGILATLDLFDVAALLPWMSNRPWWLELLLGGAFAVMIPLTFALVFWRPNKNDRPQGRRGRVWTAGAIGGIALALLLHVTLAVAFLFGIYWVCEWVVSRPAGRVPKQKTNLERALQSRREPVAPAPAGVDEVQPQPVADR